MTTAPSYKVPTRELWNTMPGWGIAADLTPPELLATRKLRRNMRSVATALVAVVGLIVVGFVFAFFNHHVASNDLNGAQRQQQDLMRQQRKYQNIVQIQGSIADVQSKLAGLLKSDADVAGFFSKVDRATPPGVAITSLNLTLGATTPSTSGTPVIGTLKIVASGSQMAEASTYVSQLQSVPGLTAVYLQSNDAQAVGTSFQISASLTDALLSHRYDGKPSGGK